MRRAIVAEQHHVIVEIHRVKFRKRAARAKRIQNFHRLRVFHFAFPRHRHVSRRQQGVSGDHGCDDIFVIIAARSFVIIGERAELMPLDKGVEGA